MSRKRFHLLLSNLKFHCFQQDKKNSNLRFFFFFFFLGDIVVQITMLSFGKSLLYAEFLPRKKLQDRMPLSLIDLVTTVGKVTLPPTESNITFSISCTDANDEDVEVPDVVAKVR